MLKAMHRLPLSDEKPKTKTKTKTKTGATLGRPSGLPGDQAELDARAAAAELAGVRAELVELRQLHEEKTAELAGVRAELVELYKLHNAAAAAELHLRAQLDQLSARSTDTDTGAPHGTQASDDT